MLWGIAVADNHVRRRNAKSKSQVSGALAASWARVSANRKGSMADTIEASTKTIDRALTGDSVPELHTSLNSLIFDETALDEVLALYGFTLVEIDAPKQSDAGDMELMSGLGRSLSELIERRRDGSRCHLDTLAMAALFRPLIHRMQAVIAEADSIRGASQ